MQYKPIFPVKDFFLPGGKLKQYQARKIVKDYLKKHPEALRGKD